MNLWAIKTKRWLRKIPRVWLREMLEPLFNRGQLLAFIASVLALWLILKRATPEERDVQALDWAMSTQAFAIALLAWAIISALRAPTIVWKEERTLGTWRGNTFSYHQPQHIFTRQFFANGLTNVEHIRFRDAERCSFVRYSIDFEPRFGRRASSILSRHPENLPDPVTEGWYGGRGAIRLDSKGKAWLLIRMQKETTPVICRVYCHSFSVGPGELSGPDEEWQLGG